MLVRPASPSEASPPFARTLRFQKHSQVNLNASADGRGKQAEGRAEEEKLADRTLAGLLGALLLCR